MPDVLLRDGDASDFDSDDIPSFEHWKEGNRGPAVLLPNDIELPDTEGLETILVAFPAFTDGRGFSVARELRRAGFEGTLLAAGNLIPDQHLYALQCGFDGVVIPKDLFERHTAEAWSNAADAFPAAYQKNYRAKPAIPPLRAGS